MVDDIQSFTSGRRFSWLPAARIGLICAFGVAVFTTGLVRPAELRAADPGKPADNMMNNAIIAREQMKQAQKDMAKAEADAEMELAGEAKVAFEKAREHLEKAAKEAREAKEAWEKGVKDFEKTADKYKAAKDANQLTDELKNELAKAREKYDPIFKKYHETDAELGKAQNEVREARLKGMKPEIRERWEKALEEYRTGREDFERNVEDYRRWTGQPMILPPERTSLPNDDLTANNGLILFRSGEVQLNFFGLGGFGHDEHNVTETHTETRSEKVTETRTEEHTVIADIPGIGFTAVQVPQEVTSTHRRRSKHKVRETRNDAAIQGGFGGAGVEARVFVTRHIGIGLEGDWIQGEDSLGVIKATVTARAPMGAWAPYAMAGAGVQFSDAETKAVGSIGIGVERRFSPSVGVFADASWMFSDRESAAVFRAGVSIIR